MTVKTGDPIPKATFNVMTPDGPRPRTTEEIFAGKKVVLIGVAGAFTPVCGNRHLPGFLDNLDRFKTLGIDEVAITAVNDVFVMDAWAKSTGAYRKVTFLADGNGDFARSLGLAVDLSELGLGTRSQRYVLFADNGVIRKLNVEPSPGDVDVSGAQALLAQL
jgi:peroxiredoxin